MNDISTTRAAADADRSQLPLSGLRVIEFCHVVMGPSCGLVLAELGADVIKVEPAPGGDRTRALKGHVAGAFTYFNRSKKSIGLDLKSAGGRAIAHRLLAEADVMTENYAPGTADRLGIGWDEVSKLNPALIYCSLKGFLPGPYEKRTALDELVQFSTGLAYMTGFPGKPVRCGASVVDIMGGVFGVVGILAALHKRNRTGKGERVQSALYESSAFLVGQHMAAEAQTGVAPDPLPIRPRSWGVYDTFTAGDGRVIFVGITSDKQWKNFCERFGRLDLFADTRYDSNEKRRAEHDELYATLQQIFSGYECTPLIDILVEIGLPAAPMYKPGDLFEDPHLNAGTRLSKTLFANGTVAKLPRLPVAIGEGTAMMNGQAPGFGEHTDEVLSGLGLDNDQIAALRKAGDVV